MAKKKGKTSSKSKKPVTKKSLSKSATARLKSSRKAGKAAKGVAKKSSKSGKPAARVTRTAKKTGKPAAAKTKAKRAKKAGTRAPSAVIRKRPRAAAPRAQVPTPKPVTPRPSPAAAAAPPREFDWLTESRPTSADEPESAFTGESLASPWAGSHAALTDSIAINIPQGTIINPNERVPVNFQARGTVSPDNVSVSARVSNQQGLAVSTTLSVVAVNGNWTLGPFVKPGGAPLDANTAYGLGAWQKDNPGVATAKPIRTQ
jgi:hypothetical protein